MYLFLHLDTKEDELNALMWPRVSAGDQASQSNSPPLGMYSWTQQRLDPLLLGSELNQYQAMIPAALEGMRGADVLKRQMLQNQQPFQFLQQPYTTSQLFQHQDLPESMQQHIMSPQSLRLLENQPNSLPRQQLQLLQNEQEKPQAQQTQAYASTLEMPSNHVPQQCSLPSQFCEKSIFPDSGLVYLPIGPSSSVPSILESAYNEGNTNLPSCSQLGHSIDKQQSRQPVGTKCTMTQVTPYGTGGLLASFVEKDISFGNQNSPRTENHAPFGVRKDPSLAPNLSMNAPVMDSPRMGYVASGVHNSLYGYLDELSGSLKHTGEISPQSQTFVKVRATMLLVCYLV